MKQINSLEYVSNLIAIQSSMPSKVNTTLVTETLHMTTTLDIFHENGQPKTKDQESLNTHNGHKYEPLTSKNRCAQRRQKNCNYTTNKIFNIRNIFCRIIIFSKHPIHRKVERRVNPRDIHQTKTNIVNTQLLSVIDVNSPIVKGIPLLLHDMAEAKSGNLKLMMEEVNQWGNSLR